MCVFFALGSWGCSKSKQQGAGDGGGGIGGAASPASTSDQALPKRLEIPVTPEATFDEANATRSERHIAWIFEKALDLLITNTYAAGIATNREDIPPTSSKLVVGSTKSGGTTTGIVTPQPKQRGMVISVRSALISKLGAEKLQRIMDLLSSNPNDPAGDTEITLTNKSGTLIIAVVKPLKDMIAIGKAIVFSNGNWLPIQGNVPIKSYRVFQIRSGNSTTILLVGGQNTVHGKRNKDVFVVDPSGKMKARPNLLSTMLVADANGAEFGIVNAALITELIKLVPASALPTKDSEHQARETSKPLHPYLAVKAGDLLVGERVSKGSPLNKSSSEVKNLHALNAITGASVKLPLSLIAFAGANFAPIGAIQTQGSVGVPAKDSGKSAPAGD